MLLMNNGVRRSDESRTCFLTDFLKPVMFLGIGPSECWKVLIQCVCKTGADTMTLGGSVIVGLFVCYLVVGSQMVSY